MSDTFTPKSKMPIIVWSRDVLFLRNIDQLTIPPIPRMVIMSAITDIIILIVFFISLDVFRIWLDKIAGKGIKVKDKIIAILALFG